MRDRLGWIAGSALLALGVVAGRVEGGVLARGEGPRSGPEFLLDLNDPSFAGDTVYSKATPHHLSFNQPDGSVDFVDFTFTDWVVRESATGRLAFHYEVEQTGHGGRVIDFDPLFVQGFSGVGPVDVYSDQVGVDGAASRAIDGSFIRFNGDRQRFAGNFVVRTNATDFRVISSGTALVTIVRDPPAGGRTGLGLAILQTAAPVPEPGAAGLLVIAWGVVAARRRRG